MPILVLALLLASLAATKAGARDLPVLAEGAEAVAGPAWRGDALLIRLRPAAARAAAHAALAEAGLGHGDFRTLAARASAPRARLGVAAVDAAAARAQARGFESLFGVAGPAGMDEALAGFYRVRLAPGAPLDAALQAFAALGDVESAEPIAIVPVSGALPAPNDSLFALSTWYWQPSRQDIHALEAWSLWTGDSTAVIGILDTGVIPYHPDLGGSVAGLTGNLFNNWIERAGVPGVDDDGNGKVDDVAGWDFVAAATNGPFPIGEDVVDADPDPNDFAGHGTMVAGIAAALTDNVIGVAGTAPNARIMPLRIGWSANVAPAGIVDMSYVAQAVVYGMQNGATVLNCSFETIASSALSAALVAAARAGVYVVFAAGNNGGPNEESRVSHIISVAATDATDHVAGFSNLGPFVDVAAPGASIRSTALVHFDADSIGKRKPTYSMLDGTSFATPMVSGAVALWESRQRMLGQPRLDPINLALRLGDTADDITALNPGVTGYGGGRLNVEQLFLAPQVSRAWRTTSRSVGPSVLVHERSGVRLAWLGLNRTLVVQDANTGDTLSVTTLPGVPARQLAAADFGPGLGVGLFAGTGNARLAGLRLDGTPLPGWPFAAPSAFSQFTAGPAIGTLDAGAQPDVACGSIDGGLWAWSAAGVLFENFPVATSALGLAGAIALADVDGEAGEEIVAAARDGLLHAVRFDGTEAAGFPVAIPGPAPAISPVVGVLGGTPAIVVAGGSQIHAVNFDGSVRWSAALGGTASQDPALADLDLDGDDEILVPITAPNGVAAIRSTGAAFATGWPATFAALPSGPPVVGPLRVNESRATLLLVGASLVALDDSAQVIRQFAKPGGAGAAPSLDDLDGDGRTEVAAGTGLDSLYYLYDAGRFSWSAPVAAWATVRGDYARRGSHVAAWTLPVIDLTPPRRIEDLAIDSLGATSAVVTWTAPGGDGAIGRADRYQVNVTAIASEAGRFLDGAVREDVAAPDVAGAAQRYRLSGLAPNSGVFVAVRAIDSTGNASAASNIVRVLTPLGPQVHMPALPLAPLEQPSRRTVQWAWRLEGGASPQFREIRLYDVAGRFLRTLELGAGESGIAEWNGRDHEGRVVPAGIIFARLDSGSFHAQSRVVLLP